ncbi:MAG: DUF3179 domain-containing protein [Candidatus Poribacteria bacterium]|nr:DUF3179 domain-containing protein [Candidatus Poribacteria bacterium]
MRKIALAIPLIITVGILNFGCDQSPVDEFLPEEVEHSIPLNEIHDGGPGKDGIPALTNPELLTAGGGDGYLRDTDLVIGVTFDGESRAYPIRILNWHELVNDRVGGRNILVSYCPLCGTGIVFDSRINGEVHTFGVSGLLYNSDLLMYERDTEQGSLWAQLLGEAVVGPLTGTKLEMLPSVQTTWEEWKALHPDTMVLDVKTGHARDYRTNPYVGYDQASGTYFPVANKDDRLFSKEWIYGITIEDSQKAYKLESLKAQGVVNDSLGGANLVLITDERSGSVRAYQRGNHTFAGEATAIHDASNLRWEINEDALVNLKTGERLERIAGVNSFWFGWVAFYPQTELFE